MPPFIRKRLGERLIEEAYITPEQFQAALQKHQESKVPLRQILVDLGYVEEKRLVAFIAKVLEIDYVRDVASRIVDSDIVKLVPEKHCRQYVLIPVERQGSELTVVMSDPFDVFAIDELQNTTKLKIRTAVSTKQAIAHAIDLLYQSREQLDEIVKGMAQEAEELEVIRENKEDESAEELTDMVDAPIIRLVNTIITQAIRERASDIHIEPDDKSLRIRYRVDGILREAMSPPKRLQAPITSRIKIMAGMDISIKRSPQDGRFRIRVENHDYDIRISTIPTIYGEKVVMRLLDQTGMYFGLAECGLSAECLKRFQEMINRPYGIILVTGPTGSGKTTTLYLALQSVNSSDKNIITIEEPVEYDLEGINQIPVNAKAGITFAKGLRSILRQDPDVIMVGEMRDLETADVAVRAALTGHLVFSTLHTNDAASSIVRMIDMGIPSYLVTSAVCCVLAQRLVRKVCHSCRESYHPDTATMEELGLSGRPEDYTFYRAHGCEECGDSGYRERAGIFELMVVDKELRGLIHQGKSADAIRSAAQQNGMKLLWEDGLEKVVKGITTIEELKRVTFIDQD